ncbi:phosphoglycerate mutase family protein [Mucilaginibacter myungsuensis]|uniref:Histidine phosphatase family protein n=1 Tax=Mucilaginibacter myungsuensis TaxID=649104 RepID=A0A929PXN2_9SPHI|nr:phosphoglycerate mutase family protein [Mucilaginibacter myungsuensis]MBE9663351.1 histidine phosphatase family protein [Mucilaginibacter myungsuensis]MDN3600086.1 phosphoglycerate mutase family protein [Mucilaginibacter myungsuensis]
MIILRLKNVLFSALLIGLICIGLNASAQKTTIFIVRHAEKAAAMASDPDLTAVGALRATELLKALKKERVTVIYTTDTKRTRQTIKPVADRFVIAPEVYDPSNLKALADKVLLNNKGKNVLIVGHSNTILPTLAAFGSEQPFSAMTDDDYDMLFKLVIKDGKTELTISRYGAEHHTTQIPDAFSGFTTERMIRPPSRF